MVILANGSKHRQYRTEIYRIVKLERLIEKFEGKQPEIVFAWKDSETEAEGWVVIN